MNKTTLLNFKRFLYKNFSHSATVEDMIKETVRKSIHISSAFTVLLAHFFFKFTIIAVVLGIVFYTICELLRLNGYKIPAISTITKVASRKTDDGKFVMGPVTLGCGLLLSLLLFKEPVSIIAIFSLSFGDGLASLVGKIYGQRHFKIVKTKTIAGSLACFFGVFTSVLFVLKNFNQAFLIATIATLTELIPLKNFDNIVIPVIVGFFTSWII